MLNSSLHNSSFQVSACLFCLLTSKQLQLSISPDWISVLLSCCRESFQCNISLRWVRFRFQMCENIFAGQIKFALFPLRHTNLLKYASCHQCLLTELCLSSLTSLNLFLYINERRMNERSDVSRKSTSKAI